MTTVLGVIADTHNLVRKEALQALAGCQAIIHAGDICKPEVLTELATLAPLEVVRGNNDRGDWASRLPQSKDLLIEGVRIHVRHILQELDLSPDQNPYNVVISGHSHRPSLEQNQGTLFLNPGSAGPRRFKLPITLAILTITEGTASAEIIDLIQ